MNASRKGAIVKFYRGVDKSHGGIEEDDAGELHFKLLSVQRNGCKPKRIAAVHKSTRTIGNKFPNSINCSVILPSFYILFTIAYPSASMAVKCSVQEYMSISVSALDSARKRPTW